MRFAPSSDQVMKTSIPIRLSSQNSALPAIACVLLAVLFSACASPTFNSAYRKSVAAYEAADPKPKVVGPWQGYWKSEVNGHTGKLRAVARPAAATVPVDGVGGRYQFRYHATWAKVLSGGYTSPHEVLSDGAGGYTLEAEKDIALLGVYKSEGTIKGDKFESKYRSDSDHGVYVLQRPE